VTFINIIVTLVYVSIRGQCEYVCICVSLSVCQCVHLCVCLPVSVSMCAFVCVCLPVSVSMCAFVCMPAATSCAHPAHWLVYVSIRGQCQIQVYTKVIVQL